MRWQGKQGSKNVDDRRGGGSARKVIGGGIGLGTIALAIMAYLMGGNPIEIIMNAAQQQPQQQQAPSGGAATTGQADDQLAEFVSVVLKYTEDVWHKLFKEQLGQNYREPTLVIFRDQDRSACGFASAATGPFYCPADEKVYIDLGFYELLQKRFKAGGDFAMAYVVAHEVAHHVQNLLGITTKVHSQKGRVSEKKFNDLSVRLELQADFLAGVWAHHAHKMDNILEEGDYEEALRAAHAIGDDRLQMESKGYVVPDSFTHGTSEQRMRWFTKGIETGDLSKGDTFNAVSL